MERLASAWREHSRGQNKLHRAVCAERHENQFAAKMMVARTLESAVKYNWLALLRNGMIRGNHRIADELGNRRQHSASEIFAISLNDCITDDPELKITASVDDTSEREVPQVRRKIVRS